MHAEFVLVCVFVKYISLPLTPWPLSLKKTFRTPEQKAHNNKQNKQTITHVAFMGFWCNAWFLYKTYLRVPQAHPEQLVSNWKLASSHIFKPNCLYAILDSDCLKCNAKMRRSFFIAKISNRLNWCLVKMPQIRLIN